jgi:cephalosporin-C deacetylase-like acetyl esterase
VAEAGVTRRFNVRIPLHDGITLAADLALPERLPAPAVVVRTPYGKAGERQSKRGAVFAKAGYACVHVDVRGRGDSDGIFLPYTWPGNTAHRGSCVVHSACPNGRRTTVAKGQQRQPEALSRSSSR